MIAPKQPETTPSRGVCDVCEELGEVARYEVTHSDNSVQKYILCKGCATYPPSGITVKKVD